MDVTDLRPLLTGRRQFQVFIDTWVGPGHRNGDGWIVHASLEYKAGTPQRPVAAVMPIFNPTSVVYGDPAKSPSRTQHLALPPGISGGRIWVLITGHGQGNTENCMSSVQSVTLLTSTASGSPVSSGETTAPRREPLALSREPGSILEPDGVPGIWSGLGSSICPGVLFLMKVNLHGHLNLGRITNGRATMAELIRSHIMSYRPYWSYIARAFLSYATFSREPIRIKRRTPFY